MARVTKLRAWRDGETLETVNMNPATMPEFKQFERDVTESVVRKYGDHAVIVRVSATVEITFGVDGPLAPGDIVDAARWVNGVSTAYVMMPDKLEPRQAKGKKKRSK